MIGILLTDSVFTAAKEPLLLHKLIIWLLAAPLFVF
jgi:hypothetical protein